MPLPHDALVLVADGRKMLFFRNHGDENQIDLRTEAHDARRERKDREIKSDAPGTVKQSAGYGRSTYEETDFQQQEEDRWIKDAADELKARVLRNGLLFHERWDDSIARDAMRPRKTWWRCATTNGWTATAAQAVRSLMPRNGRHA